MMRLQLIARSPRPSTRKLSVSGQSRPWAPRSAGSVSVRNPPRPSPVRLAATPATALPIISKTATARDHPRRRPPRRSLVPSKALLVPCLLSSLAPPRRLPLLLPHSPKPNSAVLNSRPAAREPTGEIFLIYPSKYTDIIFLDQKSKAIFISYIYLPHLYLVLDYCKTSRDEKYFFFRDYSENLKITYTFILGFFFCKMYDVNVFIDWEKETWHRNLCCLWLLT